VPVATGEHTANRVMFKQLLQLEAIDVMQIDAARVAGVNENLANLLLAAKFGVRVCPHAGGVGLCEAVQHLSMIDFVAVSGSWDNRRYVAPRTPGAGTEMARASLEEYRFRPDGGV
jgi:L-fuconate dehydratase